MDQPFVNIYGNQKTKKSHGNHSNCKKRANYTAGTQSLNCTAQKK